jgi:hypothetical protein
MPQYNERSTAWDKAFMCNFERIFGEEVKVPIVRKHTPKYYANVNDNMPREYWAYEEYLV